MISVDLDNAAFQLGLGVSSTDHGHHIAFIYKNTSGINLKICDLLWHYKLRNEDLQDREKYYIQSVKLDPYSTNYMLAALDNVSEQNSDGVPYSFRMPIEVWDDKFRYVGNTSGDGLTCATFVLSIFESNAFFIIDKNTWHSNSTDARWQDFIVRAILHTHPMSSEHANAMKDSIGNVVRYTPLQIFSAGIANPADWALNYMQASQLADEILATVAKYKL